MDAMEILNAVPGAQLVGGNVFVFDEEARQHVELATRGPEGLVLTLEGHAALEAAQKPAEQAQEPAADPPQEQPRRGRRKAAVQAEEPTEEPSTEPEDPELPLSE